MIYTNGLKHAPKFPEIHDRSSKVFYGFTYRPPTWASNTPYSIGSWVVPSVHNGWILEAISPGVSGAQEPVFALTGATLTTPEQQGLVWKARPYLCLPIGQNILESEWSAYNIDTLSEIPEIVLDSSSFTQDSTLVRVSSVPTNIESFLLRNRTVRGGAQNDAESTKEVVYRSLLITLGDT